MWDLQSGYAEQGLTSQSPRVPPPRSACRILWRGNSYHKSAVSEVAFNNTPRKDKKVTIVEEQQVMCMGSPEYNLQGKPMSGK